MESIAVEARSAGAVGLTTIRVFDRSDASRWDAFVERCTDATFFHRMGWRQIIEEIFHHRTHYCLAERDGSVVGVLPLAEVKSRLFGHALVSLPFCAYGGPAADDSKARDALIEEAVRLARALHVDHLELRNLCPLRSEWPRQDLYVTFRKELEAKAEANMLAIPRKQRAMVRKGISYGLRNEIDADTHRFFALYADNVHRHGTPPFPARYFARLTEIFRDSCEVTTVVDNRGDPVSSVLSFYFRDEVMPYYAGDSVRARELAANDFKYWAVMCRAAERGVRVFDYGRSKRGTGSYDFKRHWGFEPTPLAYEHLLLDRLSVPENNPLNPKYRVLIALWRMLPLGAANLIGPHIVRHLG